MKIQLESKPLDHVESDALLVLAYGKDSPRTAAFEGLGNGWVGEIYESGEFAGKPLEIAILPRPAGLKARKLVLVGVGEAAGWNAALAFRAVGAAVRAARSKVHKNIALALNSQEAHADVVQAVVEAALASDFEPDQYKTGDRKEAKRVESFTVVADGDHAAAIEAGRVIGESMNFARELANEPPNLLPPRVLAEKAASMASELGLKVEVLDEAQMRDLGMGALLGVAQGSAEPPRLVSISYEPAENAHPDVHLALVGKGVTFDTGGISIKPSEGMEKMKYDMCGAASVLGAIRAIALLKPKVRVTAFVPTVENMPGGKAQRPGDIVTTMSGKTVDVLNTDAEGRLILIDAFTYAQQQGVTHLIDVATLTGAIVVALGTVNTGVFTNNEGFQKQVLEAASAVGEKMWPMPADEDYRDMLKSPYADIPNISGGRWGGASTAAAFLKEFVGDLPWVHLDVAGTAWLDDGKPFMAKGPTGVAVRTFVRLVQSWS